MDINGASQQPVELQSPSLSLLRAMSLGADLGIELTCLSRAQLSRGACPHSAASTSVYAHTKSTRGATLLCFNTVRKPPWHRDVAYDLELTLSLSGRIHEFAQGLHAFNLHSVLQNPSLPLQLCFDDLLSQLTAHLTFCYPSWFGGHAKTLRKNTEYLDSILTSLSRIFDRSADYGLKQQAKSHQLRLLENVRSRLQNQAELSNSTGSSIEDPVAVAEESTNGLAHSINQDMCCIWLRLQPSEKQGNLSTLVPDTDELEIHEDLSEFPIEDENSCGDPMIEIVTDSDEEFNLPWEYCSPNPTQTILDTESPGSSGSGSIHSSKSQHR
ncbi:hypothetical protein RhiXN_05098 [Rhizoctonia solani]|uniref:Uncharacterized protein n=1 Tax=Rhizoctonia solani TaxID=456999 RepID=A0A8H8SSS6_9AGAM|nr:uncharacterized protein RhiXN_05098 [Rhizoctonia solani]QRW17096.1 hypothetical protein RhiXN_05098 [Rhizoctonia solani]